MLRSTSNTNNMATPQKSHEITVAGFAKVSRDANLKLYCYEHAFNKYQIENSWDLSCQHEARMLKYTLVLHAH